MILFLFFPPGFNYSVVVDIQNANHNLTCEYALLFDDTWNQVAEIPLTKMAVQGISSCIGPYVPFNKVPRAVTVS